MKFYRLGLLSVLVLLGVLGVLVFSPLVGCDDVVNFGPEDLAPVVPPIRPHTTDPGRVQCGGQVCNVPAQVCCFDSLGPRCQNAGACTAAAWACDDQADCPANFVCCTGKVATQPGSGVNNTVATFCADSAGPASCVPNAQVGNSSRLVCVEDADCKGVSSCLLQHCNNRGLQTCGGNSDCQ